MADVRDPVGVGLGHGRTTSPQSAAVKDSDLRAAARELAVRGCRPDRRTWSAVPCLSHLSSSSWCRSFGSENSKHPLVQLNPSPPATSAPTTSPTVAYGPILLPANTPVLPPPPVDIPR